MLPGAFSAYNMSALKRTSDGKDDVLMKEYFKSIEDKIASNPIKPSDLTLSDTLLRVFLPNELYRYLRPLDPESEEQMLYNENIHELKTAFYAWVFIRTIRILSTCLTPTLMSTQLRRLMG